MSHRNGRQAAPATATKGVQGRRVSVASSSTFDLSSADNDNYSGVDDISDDEDNEEDVFAAEEEAIREEASSPSSPPTPRPHSGHVDEWMHDDDNESDDDNDDESGSFAANENSDDDVSWAGITSDPADLPTSDFFDHQSPFENPRRVRFDVPSDNDDGSSSDSTEEDHALLYPDIFVDQSTLDPSFRRQIENEADESSASDSFWDHAAHYGGYFEEESEFEGFATPTAGDAMPPPTDPWVSENPLGSFPLEGNDVEDANDLDGYESDGETTEDEEEPHPPIRRKAKHPSVSVDEDSDSDSDGGAPVRRTKDQPLVASFDLGKLRGKPIAVYDTTKRKMIIFTPTTRNTLDLSPEHFHAAPDLADGLPWQITGDPVSPLVGNGTGMLLDTLTSGLFGHLDIEGMFGLHTADASSPSIEYDSSGPADSDADPETGLRVDDFIQLDGYSSNEEDDGDKTTEPASTPMRPTTASSDADVLSHLNPATVGAFRRNQVNTQLMIRHQATQDSLDFSGPYNSTAIRGIRSDRFETAGVPLTPVRRHKKQLSDLARSPLDAVSAKRKASSEIPNNGHKKQKSISDVGSLHL